MNAEILNKSSEATAKLIPAKSSGRYVKEYEIFCEWRKTYNLEETVNENIMLAYFLDVSKKSSSSTLWAKYSMVKSTLMVNENVDISKFSKVIAFLKKESVGHQPNQSKVLTREEVDRFMKEAPTEAFLLMKVVALLGISGGCRREELYNLNDVDLQDTGSQLIVSIKQTKTYVKRVLTVIEETFLQIFRQYRMLRPKDIPEKAFFIGYRKGKCVSQRVGIHSIGGAPRKIAEFLKLDHAERYTGHCFRRTSATLLANAGTDVNVLKSHGGWKSTSVAEKCVEESLESKTKVVRMIQGGETFVQVIHHQSQASTSLVTEDKSKDVREVAPVNISNNTNCSITVNVYK